MTPPDGYTKLPAGVRCRCVFLWSNPEAGEHWCCNKALVIPPPAPKIRLCTDCRHLDTRWETDWTQTRRPILTCRALEGQPSPINGSPMGPSDVSAVRVSSLCGWTEAKLFQPKDEPSA